MANYTYLISSLPMIFFDTEDVPTLDDFVNNAKASLSPSDIELLLLFSTEPSERLLQICPKNSLQNWVKFNIGLKNELAKARAQKLGFESEKFILKDGKTGNDFTNISGVSEISRSALSNTNPLAAELFLLEEKWKLLDELEIGKFFDIVKVIIFYLKLQIILRRKNLQNLEKGKDNYQKVYSQMMENFKV